MEIRQWCEVQRHLERCVLWASVAVVAVCAAACGAPQGGGPLVPMPARGGASGLLAVGAGGGADRGVAQGVMKARGIASSRDTTAPELPPDDGWFEMGLGGIWSGVDDWGPGAELLSLQPYAEVAMVQRPVRVGLKGMALPLIGPDVGLLQLFGELEIAVPMERWGLGVGLMWSDVMSQSFDASVDQTTRLARVTGYWNPVIFADDALAVVLSAEVQYGDLEASIGFDEATAPELEPRYVMGVVYVGLGILDR